METTEQPFPLHNMKLHLRGVEVDSHSFLISTLDEREWSNFCPPPSVFSPRGNNPLFPLNRGLIGAQNRSRSFGKEKICSPVETQTTYSRYRKKYFGLRRLKWIADLGSPCSLNLATYGKVFGEGMALKNTEVLLKSTKRWLRNRWGCNERKDNKRIDFYYWMVNWNISEPYGISDITSAISPS